MWHSLRSSRDTAVVARRWRCSVHVIYRAVDGTRWASATVLSALLERLLVEGLEIHRPDDSVGGKP